MNELPLAGLRATEPIGFLAALGLLRVLSASGVLGLAELAWADSGGWPGILCTERPCTEDDLVRALLFHMQGRADAPAFTGRPDPPADGVLAEALPSWDDVKVPLEDYRDRLLAARKAAGRGRREAVDFLSALGCELVSSSGKEVVKPSALHMTSGPQAFLATVRELALSLDPSQPRHAKAACSPDEAFREALFDRRLTGLPGWRAEDRFSSMGFDAAREAVYALAGAAPTNTGARSTRAAVWLAIEAIALFPSLPIGRRLRLRSRGFDARGKFFRWGIWDGRLSLDSVRTLLGSREVARPEPVAARLRRLGVRAVMESARIVIGQGFGQFRPAVRVAEERF